MEPLTTVEQVQNRLFKGVDPTKLFAQTFNQSLNHKVTVEKIGDDDFAINTLPSSSSNKLQPLSETYTPPQPIPTAVPNRIPIPQQARKRTPLNGILPPEIIESYIGKDQYGGSILENVANNIVQPQQPQQQAVQNPQYIQSQTQYVPQQQAAVNPAIIQKLVEDVEKLKQTTGITTKKPSENNISLIIGKKEYNGRIVQNKKSGNIMFIIDETHCFLLEPSDLKIFKKKK
jgi:hypothetical protein